MAKNDDTSVLRWLVSMPSPIALLVLTAIATFMWRTEQRLTRIETLLGGSEAAEAAEATALAER